MSLDNGVVEGWLNFSPNLISFCRMSSGIFGVVAIPWAVFDSLLIDGIVYVFEKSRSLSTAPYAEICLPNS